MDIQNENLDRRKFIKITAAAAGSLAFAFHVPFRGMAKALGAESATSPLAPNAFIEITPDNAITITISHLEMGQGVNTSMAQLIAEELECDWTKIRSISAPVSPIYNSPMGMQMTGGSSSLITSFDQYRKIGATMREMLIAAAAKKWGVPAGECRAENGSIHHAKHGSLSYGELVSLASSLSVPTQPKLKDKKHFKVIGKSVRRVDAADKSNGKAVFGLDVRLPGMLYAVIARPPVIGSTLLSFDESAAKAVTGVESVVRFDNSVAVLAKNTWAAKRGRDSLNPKWDAHGKDQGTHESLMEDFRKSVETPGALVESRGNAEDGLKKASKKITAEYEFPYLAHATMEPMNCTIDYDGSKAEIWSGHQMPTGDQGAAASILGLPPAKVKVNTVYAGGSFGRRGSKTSDYVVEAAKLAKIVKRPLQVVWTREDDMKGGYYRPMNYHKVELGFDNKGVLLGWKHRIAGQSIAEGSPFEKFMVKNGVESTVTEGVSPTRYALKDFWCDLRRPSPNISTLWWRSVGHTHTAYVMETMIDEIAHEMKKDALALRKEWLKASPRHMAVLKLLEKKSPWGKPAPKGHAYGLAIHESFNSVVGHVVDVSFKNNQVQVHRVWSAVDCGLVVNPEGAKTQVEGAFAYGLSAALFGEVAIKNGAPVTSNFHDYKVLNISQMPHFEVFFTDGASSPTGLGEPGLPPAAPAVANALFKLTGKRIRKLPFSKGLA